MRLPSLPRTLHTTATRLPRPQLSIPCLYLAPALAAARFTTASRQLNLAWAANTATAGAEDSPERSETEPLNDDELEGEAEAEAVWGEDAGEEVVVERSFSLRPYQVDCIEACLATLKGGEFSRIGVSSPTGSGKTAIFTSLIRRLPALIHPHRSSTKATRVLVIVASIELARQARDSIERTWPDLVVEIEQGSKNVASGQADVTVATYQTLSTRNMTRLDKFDPSTYKVVIVDEAHHAVAPSYLAILARFDSRILKSQPSDSFADTIEANPILSSDASNHPQAQATPGDMVEEDPIHAALDEEGNVCVPIIGFTATFSRADGLGLGRIFQAISWHADWLDMIRGNWLAPLQFVTVNLEPLDLSAVEISSTTNDFVQKSLALAVGQEDVVQAAVKAWIEKAQDRTSTLVFAINIQHVLGLTNAFRAVGIDARMVYEGTHPKERVATLASFRAREFPVLVNCGILTEGADFPAIDCVLLVRPTRSKNLYFQMMGRGLRLSPETGKTNCLLLDLVGNMNMGVVCSPTLYGIDPLSVSDGKPRSIDDLEKLAKAEALKGISESKSKDLSLRYKHHGSVFDLAQEQTARSHVPPLSSMSYNSWVGCGEGTYVLELMGNGSMKVVKTKAVGDNPQTYSAYIIKRTFGNYTSREEVATHTDLPTLLRTADAFIRKQPHLEGGIDLRRQAGWRRSPSSEMQKAMIGKKLPGTAPSESATEIDGVWVGMARGKKVPISSLTKGQASDVISRLLNGGIGAWTRYQAGVARQEKKSTREKEKVEKREQKEKEKREAILHKASERRKAAAAATG